MLVRPVEERDFEAISKLTNYFIRETTIHFGTVETTADELGAQWQASRHIFPLLVAELDGRFAGFAKAYTWRSRDAYQWTPECGVYVEDFARRKGVARALYGRLFEVMTHQGFHSVIAGIALPNDASVKLHEAMGFTHFGVAKHAGWKHGKWVDVGFWQRPLKSGNEPPSALRPPA